MAKSTDEAVLELLKKVQKQKEELRAATKKPNWLTTCTIAYNPNSAVADRINIMTVRDKSVLIDIYAFLLCKEQYTLLAMEQLKLLSDPETVKIEYMGYPISSWLADLKTRMEQIQVDDKKKDIEALDKRINGLVSLEQRRELELEAIQKELAQ